MGDWLFVRDKRFREELREFLEGDKDRDAAPVELLDSQKHMKAM